MANTKKYVSLDKLGVYDEKIKGVISAGDAAALDSAKSYADSLASNYDAAGLAATAEANAKSYTDTEVAKVNSAAAAAQTAAEAAAAAAGVADGKAVVAQGEIDALETLVGSLPEGTTATTVIDYVNKKTEGIATDAALGELNSQVSGLQTAVQGITADYLKGADKTELEGKITAVQTAVDTEKGRAEGIEAGLRTDVDAIKGDYLKGADKTALQGGIDGVSGRVATIEGDYLKAADKTELQGKIDAKVAQTAYDTKMEEIKGTTDSLQTQINTIMNNPDAEGAINSINEFTQYVADHGTIADGFREDIDQNKTDIAAEVKRAGEAEAALDGRLDVLEAINHEAYVAADTALKNELDGDIAELATAIENAKTDASNKDAVVLAEAQKATAAVQTALDEAVEALEGADEDMAGRLDALESKFTGEGSVEDMIADAQAAAEATAAADAASKANAAEAAAKGHADTEIAKDRTRLDALEAASATHALASDLTALAGRVATAEGEIDTLQSEMDAVEAKAAANETAIGTLNTEVAKKAAQADLTAVGDRVTAIETWHENFVEVSEQEINELFA